MRENNHIDICFESLLTFNDWNTGKWRLINSNLAYYTFKQKYKVKIVKKNIYIKYYSSVL